MQEKDNRETPTRRLTLRHPEDRHYARPEKYMPDFQPGPDDVAFLHLLEDAIRNASADKAKINFSFSLTGFPQHIYSLILILYAPGQKRILVSRSHPGGKLDFYTVLERLLVHPRLGHLAAMPFHLQMDFMVEPPSVADFPTSGAVRTDRQPFEFGVDGFVINGSDGETHLFLPGDSYVRSIMTIGQLQAHLKRPMVRNTYNMPSSSVSVRKALYPSRTPGGALSRLSVSGGSHQREDRACRGAGHRSHPA